MVDAGMRVGWPLLPEILGQTDPVPSKNDDFQSIFARSALAVTPSENIHSSRIGSKLRAFQRTKAEQGTLPVNAPKRTKNAKWPFSI